MEPVSLLWEYFPARTPPVQLLPNHRFFPQLVGLFLPRWPVSDTLCRIFQSCFWFIPSPTFFCSKSFFLLEDGVRLPLSEEGSLRGQQLLLASQPVPPLSGRFFFNASWTVPSGPSLSSPTSSNPLPPLGFFSLVWLCNTPTFFSPCGAGSPFAGP